MHTLYVVTAEPSEIDIHAEKSSNQARTHDDAIKECESPYSIIGIASHDELICFCEELHDLSKILETVHDFPDFVTSIRSRSTDRIIDNMSKFCDEVWEHLIEREYEWFEIDNTFFEILYFKYLIISQRIPRKNMGLEEIDTVSYRSQKIEKLHNRKIKKLIKKIKSRIFLVRYETLYTGLKSIYLRKMSLIYTEKISRTHETMYLSWLKGICDDFSELQSKIRIFFSDFILRKLCRRKNSINIFCAYIKIWY